MSIERTIKDIYVPADNGISMGMALEVRKESFYSYTF